MANKSYFSYFVLKILIQVFYLEIKPLKSTLARALAYKAKTLKSQLLKKLSTEIYELLDLSSPNISKKYLFYTSCWFFFLHSIAEGSCELKGFLVQLQSLFSLE